VAELVGRGGRLVCARVARVCCHTAWAPIRRASSTCSPSRTRASKSSTSLAVRHRPHTAPRVTAPQPRALAVATLGGAAQGTRAVLTLPVRAFCCCLFRAVGRCARSLVDDVWCARRVLPAALSKLPKLLALVEPARAVKCAPHPPQHYPPRRLARSPFAPPPVAASCRPIASSFIAHHPITSSPIVPHRRIAETSDAWRGAGTCTSRACATRTHTIAARRS
jgi:hypothetical protein